MEEIKKIASKKEQSISAPAELLAVMEVCLCCTVQYNKSSPFVIHQLIL